VTSASQTARDIEQLGREHLIVGRYVEAADSFLRALSIDPMLGSASIALIEAYRGQAAPAKALDACQRALAIVKDDPGLRLNLAWLYFEVGDYGSAIAEARKLLHDAPSLEFDSYRSLIFSTAAVGDWLETGRLLRQVDSDFPHATASIATEVASTFAGGIHAAINAGDDTTAIWRFEQLPSQVLECDAFDLPAFQALVSACHFRLKSFAGGLRLFRESLGVSNEVSRKTPAGDEQVAIVTSLMAARIPDQQRALESWRALGCRIVSVNDPGEMAALAPVFPDVEFIAAARSAVAEVGKPLVFIDDMMTAAKAAPEQTVGIVNSDIILQPSTPDFVNFIMGLTETSVGFGNRIDIETSTCDPTAPVYRNGYDWFFFRREVSEIFLGSGLAFGAPWWDLWLPVSAILSGVELVNISQPLAYHRKHPTAWSEAAFQIMGRRFVRTMIELNGRGRPRSVTASTLCRLCKTLSEAGEAENLTDDVVAQLSPVASAIIQGGMTII
jgi:hypothetical protein